MADPIHRTVLVTGANGYIGNAVARAFVRSGWITYGLVRRESSVPLLAGDEIIPILGSPGNPPSLPTNVHFDVIVSTTEQHPDYVSHYKEIISFLRSVASASNRAGVRPLVLFTSGCKDYGMMDKLATSPGLKPHTEESPLNPPPFLRDRAHWALKTFENGDLFDAVVLRPTNVYGGDSSYYAVFFQLGAESKEKGTLELTEDPNTILHAVHVDACGEAYVAIASADRNTVNGQVYNISSYRFETLGEIAQALVHEYGIEGGIKHVDAHYTPEQAADVYAPRIVLGFSQWTGSEKLRRDVGWEDGRILFSQGLHQYRLAFEAARDGAKHTTINLDEAMKKA